MALREVRECLVSLGEMLSRAVTEGDGPLSQWSSDELQAELKRRGVIPNIVVTFVDPKDGQC